MAACEELLLIFTKNMVFYVKIPENKQDTRAGTRFAPEKSNEHIIISVEAWLPFLNE